MTIAGLLAYVLAELFALPQGYWAVFSAIIVMQASVGGSVKATIDRVTHRRCSGGRRSRIYCALPKRVFSRRRPCHSARAADVGGRALAELPGRAADGRDRAVDTGRAATRTR